MAECLDLPVVPEAGSLDELVKNIEESVALFLKDEDLGRVGPGGAPGGAWDARTRRRLMGRRRLLSESQVVSILGTFGFSVHDQRGSQVKLRRVVTNGVNETLVVPLHDDLDQGTLHDLFRQASRYIAASELRSRFFFEE